MCVRSLLMAALLALSGAVLFWQTAALNQTEEQDVSAVQQDETNVTYTKKELEREAERTYEVLKQHGVRVYGWSASVHDNAVKIVVDPRDKEKLAVTQEGVLKQHYYRLVRENDPVPVYVMFEGPYVHPVGID